MNILYISVHEILEFDELKLFTEMGHNCISYGAYTNPKNPGILRPAIEGLYFNEELYSALMQSSRDNIHDKLIEWADVIIFMHRDDWMRNNWDRIAQKRVIWRSIGQSIPDIEARLQPYQAKGLQIVRYSPYENRIKGYIGADAVIRFYKDPEEYKGWTGNIQMVMSMAQSMPHPTRERELNWKAFKLATKGLPTTLFGPGNEQAGARDGGVLTYPAMKDALKQFRAYFYTGTMPACYTLGFIEALMTGIPVVAIGNHLAYDNFYKQDTYEVADLLNSEGCGYASDSTESLHSYLKSLILSEKLASDLGAKGRELAIRLFGKETIKKDWGLFL